MDRLLNLSVLFLVGLALLPLRVDAGDGGKTATATQFRVTGLYTNMRLSATTGDLVGVEVAVVQTQKGYHVVFQAAQGEPSVPVVVPATVSGSSIEFTVPPGSFYSGKFSGRITPTGMTGRFDAGQVNYDGKPDFVLRRAKSYWQ